MERKLIYVFAVVALFFAGLAWYQSKDAARSQADAERQRKNCETLIGEVETFKVRDSLNGARVAALELNVREFERFRAEDARLIKSLQAKNRDLSAVNKTQSQTIIELLAVPRDTVIIRDSVQVPAVAVHCGDAWFDFNGILTASEFTGRLDNRDSLILAETVKYRRFLGFLWRTHRVEDRQLDVISKNPHTTIVNIEHITIEK